MAALPDKRSKNMKSAVCIAVLGLCVFLFGVCGKNTVKDPGKKEEDKTQGMPSGEIQSMVGQWRANLKTERGVWIFEANGTCIIKSDGLREQKGTYSYNKKELTLNLENGSITYKIIENHEPALKLFTRWQDTYDITIPLIRAP
jgi:hypothetical protein